MAGDDPAGRDDGAPDGGVGLDRASTDVEAAAEGDDGNGDGDGDGGPLRAREVLLRVGLAGVVALVVVVAAAALPAVLGLGGGSAAEPAGYPEYDSEAIAPETVASDGRISVDSAETANDRNVVLIDDEHRNDVDREDVSPLVTAVVQTGYEVQFYRGDRSLEDALNDSDAFVVVDPQEEYEPDEAETVEQFVDNGGRLVLVGEPNERDIQLSLRGPQVTTERSSVTTLAAVFGLSFGTSYLYDLADNDGNYRSILGTPADGSPVARTDRMAFYTATDVTGRNVTPLVQTRDSTRQATGAESGTFPVAVRTGNVVAVGDSDFMTDDRYTVADNEAFVSYLGEFLAAGDFDPPYNFTGDAPGQSSEADGDGDDETTTPAPNGPTTNGSVYPGGNQSERIARGR